MAIRKIPILVSKAKKFGIIRTFCDLFLNIEALIINIKIVTSAAIHKSESKFELHKSENNLAKLK